jgi:gamma-glutamylcyclotransferase (GGCT)/AIG2-like uncharacterized protein YtfP
MDDNRPIRSFRTHRDPIATGDIVFVYGTLREGEPNHQPYLGSAVRCGEVWTTIDRYRLLDLGAFPAAEHVTGEPGAPGRGLVGEVYRVDAETGRYLDHLEGNGRLYRRALRSVYIDGDLLLSRCRAWVFEIVRPRPDAPVIDSGDWSDRLPLVDDDDADADVDIEDDWNDDGFEW